MLPATSLRFVVSVYCIVNIPNHDSDLDSLQNMASSLGQTCMEAPKKNKTGSNGNLIMLIPFPVLWYFSLKIAHLNISVESPLLFLIWGLEANVNIKLRITYHTLDIYKALFFG